jgi:SPP1 family predicted phage head-tail adaptor
MAASNGAMRQLIVIQSVSRAADGGGGYTNTWSTAQSVYAHVSQVSGTEPYLQGQLTEKGLWRFTTRYIAGITTAYRISWNSGIYNIRSVINEDERNKFLVITAEEGVAS